MYGEMWDSWPSGDVMWSLTHTWEYPSSSASKEMLRIASGLAARPPCGNAMA